MKYRALVARLLVLERDTIPLATGKVRRQADDDGNLHAGTLGATS